MMLDPRGFPLATAQPAPAAAPCRRRRLGYGIAAGALLLTSSLDARAAATGLLHLRCTNSASGANWPLVVDLDRRRADSFPAMITEKWISWHDPNQGFFDFERATGKLEFRNASSTGGYFLHYICRPE